MNEQEKIVALAQKINHLSEIGEEFYLIPRSELGELIKANEILYALDQGGVDNWEWHGESLFNYISRFCDGLGITNEDERESIDFDYIADWIVDNEYVTIMEEV